MITQALKPLSDSLSETVRRKSMNLGIGKSTITPPVGVSLAGFGHRDHSAEGVLDDLEIRAFWFELDAGSSDAAPNAACIITADLIGFDASLTADLRAAIGQEHGLPPERILLSASHTHSGPQVCGNMLGVGTLDPAVIAAIRQRILAAVRSARAATGPVTLHAGRGLCEGYAVNRRLIHDGQVLFAPNPIGRRDDEVLTIICRDAQSDAIRAVLFRYSCHPTTMGDYRITADYPGAARRHVEQALGSGAVAAFLPGCFADIRPNCTWIGGKQFRTGQPQDVAAFGAALGEAVVRVVQGPTQPLTPALLARGTTVDLPLASHPTQDELRRLSQEGTPVQQTWAAQLLSAPPALTRPLSLQRLDLAVELTLIAMGGEIVCDYGYFVKDLDRGRWMVPLGYSNGIVAYVPSAHIVAEGGYEGADSSLYFGLPAPFKPEVESLIHSAIQDLMKA
jgi:hypothetical protein